MVRSASHSRRPSWRSRADRKQISATLHRSNRGDEQGFCAVDMSAGFSLPKKRCHPIDAAVIHGPHACQHYCSCHERSDQRFRDTGESIPLNSPSFFVSPLFSDGIANQHQHPIGLKYPAQRLCRKVSDLLARWD
jgi:hypothetical protein